jgi:hypothetical protein
MQKLGMMVAVDEVLNTSREANQARQEKWLAELYAPSQEEADGTVRLGGHTGGIVQGLVSLVGRVAFRRTDPGRGALSRPTEPSYRA